MNDFLSALTNAVFVIIGALSATAGTYFLKSMDTKKAARYLAIRVVCIFDKYLGACFAVVEDDGLSCGQRTPEGCLEPQVKSPGAPVFPNDVDWKSIDHDLMYKILSFPSNVEAADRDIAFTWDVVASPPDYEEYFEERAFQYADLGLQAIDLANDIRNAYNIPQIKYGKWDPASELQEKRRKIKEARAHRRDVVPWDT
ncbi:MAG: hypothetical protein AB7E47_15100 [Desulfovibrionaceae bacterium]